MAQKRIKKDGYTLLVDEDYDESEDKGGIQKVIDSGKFPCVRSGEGRASLNRKGKQLRETIDKIRQEPVNIARGKRTMDQQDREYGKIFEENSKVVGRVRREKKTCKKGDDGQFDLVGQIPREALLEASRSSGKSVDKIFQDPGHVQHIAKDKGYFKE